MELTATIRAIESLYSATVSGLLVLSDSQYVVKGATEWSHSWTKNDWRNSKGDIVANKELWQRLLSAMHGKNISFRWVRGHSGERVHQDMALI